ncbi:MAG: hypothetical protein SF187_23735 [Deltaproteobacteria bacterium]|nr:hypothetical protein [Deltaproteobacteria bacterium]
MNSYVGTRQLRPSRAPYFDRAEAELCVVEASGLAPFVLAAKRVLDISQRKKFAYSVLPGKINGSLVMFALGLSRIDPVEESLYFEPFLCGAITAPSVALSLAPHGMNVAAEVLARFDLGIFVELDEPGARAWGAFPLDCGEHLSIKGIARRFRVPNILLLPSKAFIDPIPGASKVSPRDEDGSTRALSIKNAGQREESVEPHCPACLEPFLSSTQGRMLYHEQLWAILQSIFSLNIQDAERVGFALRRGGCRAQAARARLLSIDVSKRLAGPIRDRVLQFVDTGASGLVSRAYLVGSLLA